ncbi:MAG TPA: hypothetical protein VF498_12405 [Anaerolineales bacterium]
MTTQSEMAPPSKEFRTLPASPLGRWLLLGTGVCLALVMYGLLRTPAAVTGPGGALNLVGAAVTLLAYGLAGWAGVSWLGQSLGREALRLGALCGWLAGLVYLGTFLIEYFTPITAEQDGSLGLVEFGSVLALFFLAGLLAARQSGRIRAGIGAALACAILSGLIWFNLLLLSNFIFQGTARQEHFYAINNTLADFQRSGMSDLQVFVMQDFLGAGLFHTLLALIAGALLGALGGVFGKVASRFGARHE